MSWECPHQSGDELTCDRQAKPCKPLSKGCVLYGKVDFIGHDPDGQTMPEYLPHPSTTLRVHVLQHVPFEGLGSIADWLSARGSVRITYTRFFEDARLPPADDADLIIALGGPMSVNDEDRHPWLKAEKRYLNEAVCGGRPVLGICLGAQLIASALGARVYPGPAKEIGWHTLFAEPAQPNAFAFPAEVQAFHWHGETFDLPPGALHLAHSAACSHQAFQVGPRAIGLQFHLETTPASTEAMIVHCADELIPNTHIQSAQDLRSVPHSHYATINALMSRVLDYLVDGRRACIESK